MACTTVEGSLSCWSNSILFCWYSSKLSSQQHIVTGLSRHFIHLLRCLSRLFLNSPLCYVSLTAMLCDWGISVSLIIPSPWATVLFVSFLSPLRTSEGSFSSCTCCLFFHNWSWTTKFFILSFIYYGSLNTCYCFMCPLFPLPSLILTSSSTLAYLHCNINPKLYSILSTCLFPPSRSLFSPLLLPFLVCWLQGESQWNREAEAKQDDCVYHRIVRHGAHVQCTCTKTWQTYHFANGCVSYEVSERKWQYQCRWVLQTFFSHWPGISNLTFIFWYIYLCYFNVTGMKVVPLNPLVGFLVGFGVVNDW